MLLVFSSVVARVLMRVLLLMLREEFELLAPSGECRRRRRASAEQSRLDVARSRHVALVGVFKERERHVLLFLLRDEELELFAPSEAVEGRCLRRVTAPQSGLDVARSCHVAHVVNVKGSCSSKKERQHSNREERNREPPH